MGGRTEGILRDREYQDEGKNTNRIMSESPRHKKIYNSD